MPGRAHIFTPLKARAWSPGIAEEGGAPDVTSTLRFLPRVTVPGRQASPPSVIVPAQRSPSCWTGSTCRVLESS